MNHTSVVVVNGSRARFFILEPAELGSAEGGPNLREREDMINPDVEVHERELWTELKSGRNRPGGGGQAHGYDDHRDEHLDEFKRRFAREVAREAAGLVRETGSQRLVLAAQKRMLGFLREALDPLLQTGVKVIEVTKDLSKMPPHELHQYLAREKLVPPRRRPEF